MIFFGFLAPSGRVLFKLRISTEWNIYLLFRGIGLDGIPRPVSNTTGRELVKGKVEYARRRPML